MADDGYVENEQQKGTSSGMSDEPTIIGEDQHSHTYTSSDLYDIPVLEVTVRHAGASHDSCNGEDKKIAVYKPASSQEQIPLDDNDDESAKLPPSTEDEEMFVIEDGDSLVNLHKSVVDQYRRRTNYYGPLKAVVERVKVVLEGQEREVLRAKLMQVKFLTKNASGQEVKWEELLHTMQRIPGIIPPCEPPSVTSNTETNNGNPSHCSKGTCEADSVKISFGDNETINISKKTIEQYRKLSEVTKPLAARRERIFRTEGDQSVPVTVVRLFPREERTGLPQSVTNYSDGGKIQKVKRGRPRGRGRGGIRGRRKQQPKFLQYTALPQTLKVNDELDECDEGEDMKLDDCEYKDISSFGFEGGIIVKTSPSYNASLPNQKDMVNCEGEGVSEVDIPVQLRSAPVDITAKLSSQRIWKYLTEYASEDSGVQGLITQFNNESWLEVKRMSDFFHIDGEVTYDASFKAVYRGDQSPVTYFFRGFSRLLHSGELKTAGEVNHLFRCLSSNRKLCLGLKPSPYHPSIDNNEKVRTFFKQKGHFVSTPFEGLYSSTCRGIVVIGGSPSAATFVRGSKNILGIYALCNSCANLGKKLNYLIKSTSTTQSKPPSKCVLPDEKNLEEKYNKQLLKQPIRNKDTPVSVSEIRKIFTQSISEVLASTSSPTPPQYLGEEEGGNRRKGRRRHVEEEEEEETSRPSVGVSEEEFMQMVDLRSPNPGIVARSLVKRCNVCQFRATTMLALLTHMQGHMGTLKERCGDCKVQLSSKEALEIHRKQMHSERSPMCVICHLDFTTKDQLFDHMNKHRDHLPFECPYCKHKLTNMDAYKKHVRLTHKIKSVKELKFGCKTCDIHFYTLDHLLLHRINQNHEEVDPFVCKSCGASKATANEFRSHILEHTEEEREAANIAICLQCFKVFFSAFKLSFHNEIKHNPGKIEPEPPPAPTPAPAPAPQTPSQSELLQKKRKNKGPYLRYLRANEKHECLRCHRRFKTCETLANHVKFSHGGKKKVVRNDCSCVMCGRKFNAQRRLANHMKIHSGNRPVFQCEECGQIYGKKIQVLEHIRSDHAEQVERHQQQQQQQQHDLLQATAATYSLTDDSQQPVIEVTGASSSWSPIKSPFKVPTVEQTQEAVYSLLQLTDF